MASVVWWSVHTLCRTLVLYTIYIIRVLSLYKNIYIHTPIPIMILVTWFCTWSIAVNICDSNYMQLSIVRALNQWISIQTGTMSEMMSLYNLEGAFSTPKEKRNGLPNAFAPCINLPLQPFQLRSALHQHMFKVRWCSFKHLSSVTRKSPWVCEPMSPQSTEYIRPSASASHQVTSHVQSRMEFCCM